MRCTEFEKDAWWMPDEYWRVRFNHRNESRLHPMATVYVTISLPSSSHLTCISLASTLARRSVASASAVLFTGSKLMATFSPQKCRRFFDSEILFIRSNFRSAVNSFLSLGLLRRVLIYMHLSLRWKPVLLSSYRSSSLPRKAFVERFASR